MAMAWVKADMVEAKAKEVAKEEDPAASSRPATAPTERIVVSPIPLLREALK